MIETPGGGLEEEFDDADDYLDKLENDDSDWLNDWSNS